MMKVIPTGQSLGATIAGLDLAQPLTDAEQGAVLDALGRYGVLRFPRQSLSGGQLAGFSARFGTLEVNVANACQDPGLPQVMILSNSCGRISGRSTTPWPTDSIASLAFP